MRVMPTAPGTALARRRGRPLPDKPPGWLRAWVGVGGLVAVAATGLLMLSDRAPGLLQRVSDRIDAPGSRVGRLTSLAPLSQSDTDVHIVAWATIMVATGVVVWSWRALPVTALVVFTFSVGVEIAQELFTDVRGFELSDVAANAVGVAVGVGVMIAGHLAWAALRRRSRRFPAHRPGW
jgi:hypothetical protein